MSRVVSKVENLVFSGRDEDFEFFSEKFEARLASMKLKKFLKKLEADPVPESTSSDTTPVTRVTEDDLAERHEEIWYELVQVIDKKSLKIIRSEKPNGAKAWKRLCEHFKSSERPRVHQLLHSLTNLRLKSTESVNDYLTRAEDLQLDLANVNESVSEQMLCSVVLKGLPKEYDNFSTIFKFSTEQKGFNVLKRDLINFANDRFHRPAQEKGDAFAASSNSTLKWNPTGG